jgi:FkbM family methyltransferase
MQHTVDIREWLPKIITKKNIGSVLDVGCGDFNWMKNVNLGVPYTGVDIVESMIAKNNKLYGNASRTFKVANAIEDLLPPADLSIIRDVLYHLTYENIFRLLKNVRKTTRKYMLITTNPYTVENKDMQDGGYRKLNFRIAPFNFPDPTRSMLDCRAAHEEMFLYHVDNIEAYLGYIYKKNNPLGLKFIRVSDTEQFILTEIQDFYNTDSWGLGPDNVMLEIGGHTGEVSMTCAKKYGCKVIVYEPSPQNYERLVKNIELNELTHLVFPHFLAVTKDGRRIHMLEEAYNSGGSRIAEDGVGPEVDSITLKQIVSEIKEPIQLILMDCEGAEFEILEDLSPLKNIAKFRGELHETTGRDIDKLLERIKSVIPDSDPFMARIREGDHYDR